MLPNVGERILNERSNNGPLVILAGAGMVIEKWYRPSKLYIFKQQYTPDDFAELGFKNFK